MRKRYFYGFNIVAAGFIIQGVCIGAMFTYGVFFKELQAQFGWSRALISGASSLAFLTMGAGGMLAGALNDRVGPRLVIAVSGVMLGLGYILLSGLETPWQLYVFYGGLVGLGFCTHDVITLSTVARWFVKHRGIMSGLVKVGTGAGQFLFPLIATALIAGFGWRDTYVMIGAATLVIMVVVSLPMRRDPEGMGLLPDGENASDRRNAPQPVARHFSLREAARSGQFQILCIAEFSIFFCLFTIIVHIIPHARDLGLAPASAAAVLSTIGAVSMAGRIVMGRASDRIGGKRSLIVCFMLLIGSLAWLQFAGKTWTLFCFAAIYGFAHGGFFTVMSPTVAELFGTGAHGLLFGVVLFNGTLGGALGPWLTGYIFDLTGSYRVGFIVLTALALTGLSLALCLRSRGRGGASRRYNP